MEDEVDISEGNLAVSEPGSTGDENTATTIWDELNNWGKSLVDWQRYIIAHAVRDGKLSPDQINEACQLFLRTNKLDKGDEVLPAIPNSVTGRRAVSVAPLTLMAIQSLKNVNAIPENSALTFGRNLTVIYGHNGAGKSGFARILSAACFSRSSPQIIPNIYDEDRQNAPATAEFVVYRGNGEEKIEFTEGDEQADLRRISVFDTSVARIHLAKENELGFQPAGFDVFDETVRAIGLIAQKLEFEIAKRSRPNKFSQLFTDPGPVAEQITALDARSDITKLIALGTFGNTERKRLDEVARQEKELLFESPVETLKALATAKADIETLQTKLIDLVETLSSKAPKKVQTLLEAHKIALLEAVKAGSETISHSRLTNTGTKPWDDFIVSARDLGRAESDTYPVEGDPCLLCHRSLDEPSASLIRRMWGYLDHEARKVVAQADEQINEYIEQIKALEVILLPDESRIRTDVAKIKPELVNDLDKISSTLADRRDGLVKALEAGLADQVPTGDFELSGAALNEALKDIVTQEASLRNGEFDELLTKLKTEYITLLQRQVLSNNIEDVVAYVEDLAWIMKAEAVRPTTRFVTERQKSVFKKLIGSKYKERRVSECQDLDCRLPIEFKAKGSAGKTFRGIKAKGGYMPDTIFSEGEQRALSLADFLTEVSLNPNSAAIVLDDPVTSMDHKRKRAIAKRLVHEAGFRQVIVFTHDLVFLTLLSDQGEAAGHEPVCHWVQSLEGSPGHVNLDETPANNRFYRTTTKAKDCLARAKREKGNERLGLIKDGAGAVRRTLEVIVEHYLFKDTVKRWDEQIRLGAMTRINWSNDVADEIVALQADASRLLEGHSNSDEFAGEMPDVDNLEKLITRVDAVIEKAKVTRQ